MPKRAFSTRTKPRETRTRNKSSSVRCLLSVVRFARLSVVSGPLFAQFIGPWSDSGGFTGYWLLIRQHPNLSRLRETFRPVCS